MRDAIPLHEVVDLLAHLALEEGDGRYDDGYNDAISDVAKGLRIDDPVQALDAARRQNGEGA
jgi:hypothetical protein